MAEKAHLKPVTFKIDGAEIKKLEREAGALRPPKSRSEYVRDIVLGRDKPKIKRPNAGERE